MFLDRWLRSIITQEINRLAGGELKVIEPPVGYNSLDRILGAVHHWVPVPFNGEPIWCLLRTLNATQLEACGAFTLIDLDKDKTEPKEKLAIDKLIELRNKQEELVRAAMVKPTFDEMLVTLTANAQINEKRKEIAEIEKLAEGEMTFAERTEVEAKLYKLKLFTAFMLPEDAFGFITSWVLGVAVTDIKKLTREQLLDAAILAKNASNDPSDHLSGVFTDRDREDINKVAWSVYQEHQEMKQIEKDSNTVKFTGSSSKRK